MNPSFPIHPYRQKVQNDFNQFLESHSVNLPKHDLLKIDLHCHDHNSDIPDELWGRILRLPETWLPTETQIHQLQANACNVLTITNHNNARSCWYLQDKGVDLLPGCEFSVTFQELDLSAHVLAYGFTPAQESILNKLRAHGNQFMDYCQEHDLALILPHPLFLYHQHKALPMDVFEKLALMFSRFEVVNGQRDVLQNLLSVRWVESMTPENLEKWSKTHGISMNRWCENPYKKKMFGGSDDHFALFSGHTGTYLHVPELALKLKTKKPSELALEAIKHGETSPFGQVAYDEKLSIAFMDYFCQVALKMEDPGLLRMALHRGNIKDKLACLAISNAMQELKRHKYTVKFLNVFHDALQGQKPGLLTNLSVNKDYKPLLEDISQIAAARKGAIEEIPKKYLASIESMFYKLNQLVAKRLSQKLGSYIQTHDFQSLSADDMIRRFEIPSHFRMLATPDHTPSRKDMSVLNVSDLMDQLSFPTLAATLIAGARFAGSRVIHNDRETVTHFSNYLGCYKAPQRALWLTDTLYEKNGVSNVLLATLKEVQKHNLPIDFLVCSDTIKPQEHLIVVPSMGSFALPKLSEQRFHFPNLLDIQRVFQQGAYDRVIASTEFCMGGVALYLQQAFKVKAYMYMHTDWMDYVKQVTRLDEHNLDRIRRMLRALYRQFDGMFVLNSEHKDWLTSPSIGIKKSKVHLTAHWTEEWFTPTNSPVTKDPDKPTFLFAGRLSEEKGVLELPEIMNNIRTHYPEAQLWVAGVGNAQERLLEQFPDVKLLGWVENHQLPPIYAQVDMLLLPSRFDTFGCVVTEAMSCGVPVGAFNSKGPRDIISHGVDGLLAPNAKELGQAIVNTLHNHQLQSMGSAALEKAATYQSEGILSRLMNDLGFDKDSY